MLENGKWRENKDSVIPPDIEAEGGVNEWESLIKFLDKIIPVIPEGEVFFTTDDDEYNVITYRQRLEDLKETANWLKDGNDVKVLEKFAETSTKSVAITISIQMKTLFNRPIIAGIIRDLNLKNPFDSID